MSAFYRVDLEHVGPNGQPAEGARCAVMFGQCIHPPIGWKLSRGVLWPTCDGHRGLCRSKLPFCDLPAAVVRLQEVIVGERTELRGQPLCDVCASMLSFVKAFGMSWAEYQYELRHPLTVAALQGWAKMEALQRARVRTHQLH